MRKENPNSQNKSANLIKLQGRPHQESIPSSCVEINQNPQVELKDYTLCDSKSGKTTTRLAENQFEKAMGFPNPCKEDQLQEQLLHITEQANDAQPLATEIEEEQMQDHQEPDQPSPNMDPPSSRSAEQQLLNFDVPQAYLLDREDNSSQSQSKEGSQRQVRRRSKREKNETKNIIKNYGKRLIKFVKENRPIVEGSIVPNFAPHVDYEKFLLFLKEMNGEMARMGSLMQLWTNETYGKLMRVVSDHFLRKHGLHYIFNSRVEDIPSMLKYKKKVQKILSNPSEETSLKFN